MLVVIIAVLTCTQSFTVEDGVASATLVFTAQRLLLRTFFHHSLNSRNKHWASSYNTQSYL